MTNGERQAALEQIADEVRSCTRCRLHEQRTRAVPGEGNPDTEVVFVGEGPGFNEDREGRPFVGRAGGLLVKLLESVGWQRQDVFITNVVKCRPPENRDPQPDEIAACAPYLQRQLAVLDPALVVTLGRYSMGTFMPGARISQAHGTMKHADPATGASDALAFAMYHPAAALRATDIERTSFRDMAGVPLALLQAREIRERHAESRAGTRERPTQPDATTTPDATAEAANAPAAPDAAPDRIAAAQEPWTAPAFAPVAAEPAPAITRIAAAPPSAPTASVSIAAINPAGLEPDPSTDQMTLF